MIDNADVSWFPTGKAGKKFSKYGSSKTTNGAMWKSGWREDLQKTRGQVKGSKSARGGPFRRPEDQAKGSRPTTGEGKGIGQFMNSRAVFAILLIFILLVQADSECLAQDEREAALANYKCRIAERDMNFALSQLIVACQGNPALIDGINRTQSAWVNFRDADTTAIATLPIDPKDERKRGPLDWKNRLAVNRTSQLRNQFSALPEMLRLKARPPWPEVKRTLKDCDFTTISIANLETSIPLTRYYHLSPAQAAKTMVWILFVDLNQDDLPDMIVKKKNGPGNVGYALYRKRHEPRTDAEYCDGAPRYYDYLGTAFGTDPKLLAPANHYYQIEITTFTGKEIRQFGGEDPDAVRFGILSSGNYHRIRADQYARGKYQFTRMPEY